MTGTVKITSWRKADKFDNKIPTQTGKPVRGIYLTRQVRTWPDPLPRLVGTLNVRDKIRITITITSKALEEEKLYQSRV
jgi:hypothetical protein